MTTLPRGERPVGDDDLAAYVDGRLAPDRTAVVDLLMAARPDIAAHLQLDREARETLRLRLADKAAEPIPARLRIGPMLAERRRGWRRGLGLAAAACLLLLLGGAAGWSVRDFVGGPNPLEGRSWVALSQEALAAHRTFTVEIVHPVEVRAADEAHLTQWLSKRLRRKLLIPDLETLGLNLVGGRLLPAGKDVAALLMYADASGSRLTLYVRCGEEGESAMKFLSEGQVSSFSWVDEGIGYVVSASMDRQRLQKVARTINQEIDLDTAKQRKAL